MLASDAQALFVDAETSVRVIDAVASIATLFDCEIPQDSPLLPLVKLVAEATGTDAEIAQAMLALPEDSLAIAMRLADDIAVDQAVLYARRTSETDDAAYLAQAVNGFGFLIVSHLAREPTELAGLRAIVRDPSLGEDERVQAILALHPQAADLCSQFYANGPAPDEAGRFYPALPLPWGTCFGDPSYWQVIDRETNAVVLESKWARNCEAFSMTMNAFPAIGARMADLAAAHYGQDRPTLAQIETFNAAWAALTEELGSASSAWRADGNLPLYDPWAPSDLPMMARPDTSWGITMHA